jgi:L-threonylcarbamoyladenylate synthase
MPRSKTHRGLSTAKTYRGTARNLATLAGKLRNGELVAVPTETVYGLAASAFDAKACGRIFTAKRRPPTDPLIVHLESAKQLPLVCIPNESARRLARRFWPGPLTLVLPKTAAIPGVITAGRDSVAVRVSAHPLFRRLLKLAGVPLAAPSANPFGYVSPTTAEHVQQSLGRRIRHILDGGPTRIGLESTIVDLRDEKHPRLLRPGAITRQDLERVLHRRVAIVKRAATSASAQAAPGMLARHYSPRTRVTLHQSIRTTQPTTEAFVFMGRPSRLRGANVFWLDAKGNLPRAARRLFATLRQLDRANFKRIHVELAQGDGMAVAINDRLRRAAAR